MQSRGAFTRIGSLSLVLFLVAVSFIASVAIGHIHYGSSAISSSTSTTTYRVGWTFYVEVNYSKTWIVYYQGYASSNIYNPTNKGDFTNHGFQLQPVGVNGTLNNGLSLCIAAEKEDNSSSVLFASVFVDNPTSNGVSYRGNTSLPFGSVNLCIDVGPY